jgi:hypothetical protein
VPRPGFEPGISSCAQLIQVMRLDLLLEGIQDLRVSDETYVATAPSRLVIGPISKPTQYIRYVNHSSGVTENCYQLACQIAQMSSASQFWHRAFSTWFVSPTECPEHLLLYLSLHEMPDQVTRTRLSSTCRWIPRKSKILCSFVVTVLCTSCYLPEL